MGYQEEKYPISIDVMIVWSDDDSHADSIKGLNEGHAVWRAWQNWPSAKSITVMK